jgi:hypothetical protein
LEIHSVAIRDIVVKGIRFSSSLSAGASKLTYGDTSSTAKYQGDEGGKCAQYRIDITEWREDKASKQKEDSVAS